MFTKKRFQGKNLEEALREAAQDFGVDRAFVCYDRIPSSSGGFFSRIFSVKVEIEAWVETARETLQEAARKAVREALRGGGETQKPSRHASSPRSSSVSFSEPAVSAFLKEYATLFFNMFHIGEENYSIELMQSGVFIQVEDDFLEKILTRSDKLSLSFEHVFRRMAQKKFGEIEGRLSLQSGNSREKREEHLVEMAKVLAQKVQKTGRSVTLFSKSSQERRIIHLALQDVQGIGTKSVGMGEKRKLMIYPLNTPLTKNKSSKKAPRKPKHSIKRRQKTQVS